MKFVLALLVVSSTVFAGPAQRVARRVNTGVDILNTRQQSAAPIPFAVLQASKCVAAVKVVKAGFIFGGEGSVGLVSCRLADGSWSMPSFLNIGGASFGLQIGGQVSEIVLVFMSDFSRQVLARGTVKLGADLDATAGPVGQGVGIGAIPNAQVLTYSRSVGLFAGITINGTVVGHAPTLNAEAYNRLTPAQILATPANHAPAVILPFTDTLKALAQ